jgi:3-oxoacyl-ACP reductase-like protein
MTSRSLPVLAAALVAASVACREDTAAQSSATAHSTQTHATTSAAPTDTDTEPSAVLPLNPADRSIRRELNLAIDRDPELKDRSLIFVVGNGDVRVTGTVRTETERERINALALSIAGVKSIANEVRVSP